MTDEPNPPFTIVEAEIARLAGRGYGSTRIAFMLHRRPKTIEKTIERMALKLPNPDELRPLTLVQLWSAYRIWINTQPQDKAG